MADPAPSAPLPDAASERRVSPADQMAALTGEPVELSQPEADEPAEDHNDASTARQIDALAAMAPFERTAPAVAAPSNDPTKHAPATTSNSAETPVSPPAPREPVSSAEPPRAPNATPPNPSTPTGVTPQAGPTKPRRPLFRESPGPSERGFAKPSGRGAAQRDSDGRRSPDRRSPSRRAACRGLHRTPLPTTPARRRPPSSTGSRSKAFSTIFAGRKRRLPRLRRRRRRARPPPLTRRPDATAPKAASPAGGLRDKLGVFTADRMQARRDAEQIKGVTQAGAAVLASLEALERQETTGILMKIRDAANANGGIERVLSEMRPGGAFEDLRKEFNVALSHDEGFAAAYEKATGALSSYAETRAGMISAPRPRADINLARLETLDQEIGAAAKTLPGLKDGKNALDEALEGGKEAVEKAFTAIRQAFTRDAEVRGPSPSPRFGP